MKSLLKKLFPSKEERARLAEEKQKLQEQQIITIFERDGRFNLEQKFQVEKTTLA